MKKLIKLSIVVDFSIFTNFGDTGTSTYWFDDVAGAVNGDPVPAPITYLNVDFETATSFAAADGAVYTDLTTNTVTDRVSVPFDKFVMIPDDTN